MHAPSVQAEVIESQDDGDSEDVTEDNVCVVRNIDVPGTSLANSSTSLVSAHEAGKTFV